jgi:hypothetical protein
MNNADPVYKAVLEDSGVDLTEVCNRIPLTNSPLSELMEIIIQARGSLNLID